MRKKFPESCPLLQRRAEFLSDGNHLLVGQTPLFGAPRHFGGDPLFCLQLPFAQGFDEPFHRFFAILQLGAALAGLRHDTRRQVPDADGRVRRVAMLPTRARGPVKFNAYVCVPNFHAATPLPFMPHDGEKLREYSIQNQRLFSLLTESLVGSAQGPHFDSLRKRPSARSRSALRLRSANARSLSGVEGRHCLITRKPSEDISWTCCQEY